MGEPPVPRNDVPPEGEQQLARPAASEGEEDLPEPISLPRWVPVLIGAILVAIAGFAVYTGFHYKQQPFAKKIARSSSEMARELKETGAPGEPQPGASRVMHGRYGENVPRPGEPVAGESSRVAITGGGPAITHTVRWTVRRGMLIDVTPPDAIVYVNDEAIGAANQFRDPDEVYEFAESGRYDVRIVAPGHRELEYVITSSQDAKDEIAVIRATLQPAGVN